MDHQYIENGVRNMYSNYNQMRANVECFPNHSKKLSLIDFSIEQSTKRLKIPEKIPAVSVSEFYHSIAVQLDQPMLIRWLSSLYVYK